MIVFADCVNRYPSVRMQRRNDILEVTLHTKSDSLRWDWSVHTELPSAFADIGTDRETKVVIITGTGDEFIGPQVVLGANPLMAQKPSFEMADRVIVEGKQLLMNLLNIDVPVISAVNGPAWRHSAIALLGDIVLASDTACFQDSGHFRAGHVPGDGHHIVFPLLLGWNRARYFLLTGQILSAVEARDLGLVAEVLPKDRLLARAWELAEGMAIHPIHLLRMTRIVLTERLKREVQEMTGYGLQAQFMAAMGAPDAR